MYEIEDRGAAIAEVQRLLDLNQTRIFDKKTINSVAEHQKSQNLEVTGIVDYATFLSLVASKKSRENNKIKNHGVINASVFPIKAHSQGYHVEHINSLLSDILTEYRYDQILPRGKYFGQDTMRAVMTVQEIFDLPKEEHISVSLYNRILAENEAILIKKRFR